jgi:hypothetical protein
MPRDLDRLGSFAVAGGDDQPALDHRSCQRGSVFRPVERRAFAWFAAFRRSLVMLPRLPLFAIRPNVSFCKPPMAL